MRIHRSNHLRSARAEIGFTLVEIMVAVVAGTILLAVIGALSLFALRSFTAMGNYTDLDAKSRMALDQISRDLRECTTLLAYDTNLPTPFLLFTNSTDSVSVRLTWDSVARTLTTATTGQPVVTNLTECDAWQFDLFQQTPIPNKTNQFYGFTGGSTRCKLVNMTWKCSRVMLGKKQQTESVQTAKIVMRNAR